MVFIMTRRFIGCMLVAGAMLATTTFAAAQSHAGLLAANWTALDAGTATPELAFTNASGETQTLADYAGKAVVVNFWATWCGPCRAEMPTLEALAERRFDGGDHVVLAIALEPNFQKAERFLSSLGVDDLTMALDDTSAGFRSLGAEGGTLAELRGLPSTFVVGVDGSLVGYIGGPADWDDETAHEIVAVALARNETENPK